MNKIRVRDIIGKGDTVCGDDRRIIAGITCDSRKAGKGWLFVAVKGERVNGNDFIEDAFERGAAAVVYEKGSIDTGLQDRFRDAVWIGVDDIRDAMARLSHAFYGRPSEQLTVVGITGTNGKTTTSYLIKAILEQWGKAVGLIGTIQYLIRDTVAAAPHTTPEAPDFQALLREMADRGCSHIVTEVSSHALAQKRVAHTRFAGAVFTNLTRDHLDFHKTMDAYFEAKERLFTELLAAGGFAVVNADDAYGRRLLETLRERGTRTLSYAVENADADVTVSGVKSTFKGLSFTVRLKEQGDAVLEAAMTSPLVGTTNLYNILSAVSAARMLGIPFPVIREGIAMAGLVKGRFEKVDVGQDFLAVVDYAHTEDALERLLLTARQLLEAYRFVEKAERMLKVKRRRFSMPGEGEPGRAGNGKIITVVGCGGNRDKGKRSKMGAIAAALSDFVIITSDNPRNEDPKAIIRDIEKGIKTDNYIVIPDRHVAISMAVELASSGDIVLVAGKGHEDYQEIKGIRHGFSDRTALENAIRRTISRPAFGGGSTYDGLYSARSKECSC
ncbi:MAG: UDP-N-acetylmuramoyl-L-alanyl-D-glutamate--2,6-diaminopimelate ligase [Nitrospirota bacterium]